MESFMKEFEHLEIKLEDIISATNNFSENKVIGNGGFGKVYKGELSRPEGKITVAFKRLDRKYGQGDPEFLKEIRMLSCFKHKNLISLLGFCKEGDEMILIYEYASRGSLDRILHDGTLTWTQRLKICLDAAMALSFLHDPNGTQQRVLHRDIKSANILLDENLNAKLADFGLSKISPANQKYTFLFTGPVGTPGYCDPLYMDTYQLTKESDVYSFGVVLFEVLCGRVCYENINGKIKVFVHFWKKCYEQNKLDEIIFPDIVDQLNPSSAKTFTGVTFPFTQKKSSAKTFVDIAYQCLQKSHGERPTMSVVVEKLEAALELHEQEETRKAAEYEEEQILKAAEYEAERILKAAEQEYKQMPMSADPPLRFLEFPFNGGKTLLSINDKGEVFCERICIEACLDQIQYDRLQYPSGFENSRFSGGRCYCKAEEELKVRVRAQFLCPLITYSVNIVFRNERNRCKTLHYDFDWETKCCMVYDSYEREDGWFVVPLYQFTSDHKTAKFKIKFEGFQKDCMLQVAGFEFQVLEEKVELHDQGLEEYQDIVTAASYSMFYKSLEELKELLSIGLQINNNETWFSLNENGEHCEMLSIAHCLIFGEGDHHYNELYTRFPSWLYKTNYNGFKVHIRTQFLTPSIRYTVNLVLCKNYYSKKQMYVALKYRLEGETETSIVNFATETNDNRSFIAELYQFTSNGRTFELEIVFEDHKFDLQVEGILFQPLEKVEHEQVLDYENLSYDNLQWTITKVEKNRTDLFKWFRKVDKSLDNGQKAYAVDKDGKKSLMLAARGVIETDEGLSFKSSPESRFQEVAVITTSNFRIEKKIESDAPTPETTYACYLVYKLPKNQPILKVAYEDSYIYLVIPPDTPIIGEKLDQNTQNPLHRPKLNAVEVPRQRSDGWMEVKVYQLQTPSYSGPIDLHTELWDPAYNDISELIIESMELRPIMAHST